jgi:hypothetical protein
MKFPLPATTPKELKARYPYQLAGPHIGLSFYRGWMPVFAQLCADIDAQLGPNKRGFHWVQMKEKFGSARWYFEMDLLLEPNEAAEDLTHLSIAQVNERFERLVNPQELALHERIRSLRREAHARTQTACIVCGELAEVDRSTGPYLVLCPEHARQRRRGDMEPAWFDDEEKGPDGGVQS